MSCLRQTREVGALEKVKKARVEEVIAGVLTGITVQSSDLLVIVW
jgi:hypothetical protein